MHEPDSYNHISTPVFDLDDHLIVNTTYTGKNAFGARVKNYVKAKISLTGEVLEIIEQQPLL